MSLWYCTRCGRLMINSMVCRCGEETYRVTDIDTNGQELPDSWVYEEFVYLARKDSSTKKQEQEVK